MKKRTLLALAVAMSVTAVAAANPFSDVPAKHWAYDSVTKLEKAGIVEGYGDATYRGDRTMTRYEMAQIIARAMANSEKADAALKAELDKLSVEFAKELKNLGVRVTALENQSQNVKFSGDLRLRYDHGEKDVWAPSNQQKARFRLQAEGKVNDNWSVVGRFEAVDDLRSSEEKGARSDVKMDKMFAKGQYGDFGIRLGRIDVLPAYGIFYDDYMDAAEITWSNDKFYGALRYGQFDHKDDKVTLGMSEHYDTYMAEIGILNVVKGLNIRGMYAQMDGKDGVAGNSRSGGVWEAGLDYSFGSSGFKITAAVADTTSDLSEKGNDDTIWFTEVGYKGAKKAEVGSWGAFVGYRDFQDNTVASMRTTFNTNGKGWYVGGSYTPAKNIVLKAWYESMKPESSDKSIAKYADQGRKDYVRAQAEFFF